MNRKITTAIFGRYDPWIADSALLPIDYKYRMSQYYKQLKEEEMKYLLEKWYFLRKFFNAEKLCEDIIHINEEFRLKWLTQKRKEYNETHRKELKEKCKSYNEQHREQINKRRGEKVVCECGAVIRRDYLSEHKKPIKHKENIPKL